MISEQAVSGTCCCCCSISTGVSCLCGLDIFSLLLYGGILGFGAYIRNLVAPLDEQISEGASDIDDSIIGTLLSTFGDGGSISKVWEDLKEEFFSSIDCMIAFGGLGFLLIFLPRFIVFIYMKVKDNDTASRKALYCVRLVSHILQVFLMLSVIIALIVLGFQSFMGFMKYINAPIMIIIGCALCCVLLCESYYVCVVRRFWEAAKNMIHFQKANNNSQRDSTVVIIQQAAPQPTF